VERFSRELPAAAVLLYSRVFITAALMCPGEDFHSSSGWAATAIVIIRLGMGEKQREIRGQGNGKEMKRGGQTHKWLGG